MSTPLAVSATINPLLLRIKPETLLNLVTQSQQLTLEHRSIDQSSATVYSDNSTANTGSITGPVTVPCNVEAVVLNRTVSTSLLRLPEDIQLTCPTDQHVGHSRSLS